jgi:hypothetical protein
MKTKSNYKMKRLNIKAAFLLLLALAVSCDDPVTILTNIIRPDGSVLRKIEMRSSKNNITNAVCQVPLDDTWKIRDSVEIGSKHDTTWVRRAEKVFANTSEINYGYKRDTTPNGKFSRHSEFSKKFKWFNTEYRFSEIFDKRLSPGISIHRFLNEEEYRYFYSPPSLKNLREHGPDSTRYKSMADSISRKTDLWSLWNVADIWVTEFSKLLDGRGGPELRTDSLRKLEGKIVSIIPRKDKELDSLWKGDIIQKEILGESNANMYKNEIDSAANAALNNLFPDWRDYSVRIVMPGKLTGTNGYIDSSMNLVWPVSADLFMSDNYVMWAESKTPNIWAWIVSGLFLVFVITGIILRKRSRGGGT